MANDSRLLSDRFPRASAYHPDWIVAGVSGGANPLWLTEWLTSAMELRPGMRVLDLGCGRAMSSIFLHREFGVQVWAADLWFSVSENNHRIRDAGVEAAVFPIHTDARSLPFATEFFDAVVSIDSYFYYGTDDYYLNYLARFVKPDGVIAIASAGLTREFEGSLPGHLKEWWTTDMWGLHSAEWWRWHLGKTGIVEVVLADDMPDGWKFWLDWHRIIAPDNAPEINALEMDKGEYLGYVRAIGKRRGDVALQEPITSFPMTYKKTPLLRNEG